MSARPARVLALVCGLSILAPPTHAQASDPTPPDAALPVTPSTAPAEEASEPLPEPTRTPTPRPRRGIALMSVGVPLSLIGITVLVFGGAFFWNTLAGVCEGPPCSSSRSPSALGVSLVATGLVVLGSGAAMTAVGAVRHHRFRRWKAAQTGLRWTPAVTRSAHGTWTLGASLRF